MGVGRLSLQKECHSLLHCQVVGSLLYHSMVSRQEYHRFWPLAIDSTGGSKFDKSDELNYD